MSAHQNWMLLAMSLSAIVMGCKKTPDEALTLNGVVTDMRTGEGLEGVDVVLEEQVVEAGVWVGTWSEAGATTTDAMGQYEIGFGRKNALAYQTRATKPLFFPAQQDISADNWRGEATSEWHASLVPKGWAVISFVNSQPFGSPEATFVDFRLLHTNPMNLPVCGTDWVHFVGNALPAPEVCLLEGDRYLPFTLEVERDGELSVVIDSVYVSRFDTTMLQISF